MFSHTAPSPHLLPWQNIFFISFLLNMSLLQGQYGGLMVPSAWPSAQGAAVLAHQSSGQKPCGPLTASSISLFLNCWQLPEALSRLRNCSTAGKAPEQILPGSPSNSGSVTPHQRGQQRAAGGKMGQNNGGTMEFDVHVRARFLRSLESAGVELLTCACQNLQRPAPP